VTVDFKVVEKSRVGFSVLGVELDCSTRDQALGEIAAKLEGEEIVTPDFQARLLEREQTYPTGLALANMGIAIPHVEAPYCRKDVIVVARNRSELEFNRMDAPQTVVRVRLMIVLCMSDPQSHLETLGRLSEMFVGGLLSQELLSCDLSEICKIVSNFIDQGV
jgi:PTS system galactitol-specific IIA component